MRNRTAAVWLAGVLAMECAFGVGAAPAVILGESETETARETAGSAATVYKKEAGKETDPAPETVKEKKESDKDTAVPGQNADNTADSCAAEKEKEA